MKFVRSRPDLVRVGIGIAAVGAVVAFWTPASGATSAPTSGAVAIAYPGCPAGSVTVTLSASRRSFPPGVPVRYQVRLRNRGRTCGPTQSPIAGAHSPALLGALLGPCGALPLAIRNAGGAQVYPPFEAIACPAFLGPKLPGKATLTVTRSWNQMIGGGRPARRLQLAPRGRYHITVDDKVRLPIVLTSSRSSSGTRGTPARKPPSHTVTRSGPVDFEGCGHVLATVTVPASVGAPVQYSVTLTNEGTVTCGPTPADVPLGGQRLTVGACGILPAVVRNAAGVNIYPGPIGFMCPMETFVDIPAHESLTATGIWPGSQALGPAPPHVGAAPPGRYRIEVGRRPHVVSVPFTLVAPSRSSTTTRP